MIRSAKSLQAVAKELLPNPGPIGRDTPHAADEFLLAGRFLAAPILLALAAEIALKAWQFRERNDPHDHGHDLLKLFEALSPEARDILEAQYPKDLFPPDLHVLGPVPSGMRRTLEIHRETFVHWRYAHENPDDHAWPSALDAALTAIVEAYDAPHS